MTKVKKWQCPLCRQESARRWNMEVHLKRAHRSEDQSSEKNSIFGHAQNLYNLNQNRMYSGRRPRSNSYGPNHHSGNYLEEERIDESDKNTVDYVHDKMLKLNEIMDIKSKYNSSTTSQWMPIPIFVNFPTKNTTEKLDVPYHRNSDPPYFAPKHPTANNSTNATDINQVKRQTARNFPGCEKNDDYQPQNPSWHFVNSDGYVSEDDPSLNERWFVKRDMYGDVIHFYKLIRDQRQELLDFAKEHEKDFTFAPGQN